MKKILLLACSGVCSLLCNAQLVDPTYTPTEQNRPVPTTVTKSYETPKRVYTTPSAKMADDRYSILWGVNLAKMAGDGASLDSEAKFLNFAFEYTSEELSNNMDISMGIEYSTRGGKDFDPSVMTGNLGVGYNFYCNDSFRIAAVTGPNLGAVINEDDLKNHKSFYGAWFFGARMFIQHFTVKIGYELAMTDLSKDFKSKMNAVSFRVGFNF